MIGKAIAGWIGSKIDQRDGEGGTLGALAGVAVYSLGKRVIPAALVLGGAALAVRHFQKSRNAPV